MKPGLKKRLRGAVNGLVSFDRRLKDYTTFRIGGAPRVWVEPDGVEDLKSALRIFSEYGIEPFVIGGGSNLLVSDGEIDKAVIRLSAPYFKRLEFGGRRVSCGSGSSLSSLITRCADRGLSGLEELAGIPGTVGGAIMMNAGRGHGGDIGKFVEYITVIDRKGKTVRSLGRARLKFKYRNSGLSKYIILEAGFLLKRRRAGAVRKRFRHILGKKVASQEYRLPSAGCVFRNPLNSKLTSGKILDKCGLKGLRIGGAEVSEKHANFIVNRRNASFDDVISLIELERRVVRAKAGITLKTEIEIVE